MTIKAEFQLGSISTGTRLPEDLLPAFGSAADALGFDPRIDTQSRSLEEVIEYLIEILNGYCPSFVYFGAHPDDDANFGFWLDVDAIIKRLERGGAGYAAGSHTFDDCVILVDLYGDFTMMDVDRNVLWTE